MLLFSGVLIVVLPLCAGYNVRVGRSPRPFIGRKDKVPPSPHFSQLLEVLKKKKGESGSKKRGVDFEPITRDETAERQLVDIVENGLPKLPDGEFRKVVVVGAGMAGLCASYELLRAGYDVELLERTERPCGRVYTLREPFSDGLWGEAGAMRIPAAHFLDWAYITKLGIETNRFQNSNPNAAYYFDEPNIPNKRTFGNDKKGMARLNEYWNKNLDIPIENLPIDDKFEKTMDQLAQEIEECGYDKVVAKYDEMTYEQFLRSYGWSDNEILLFGVTSTEESYLGSGAVENFSEFEGRVWDDTATGTNPVTGEKITGLHEITGGMDRFGKAFLTADTGTGHKKVEDILKYGACVSKLKTAPDSNGLVTVEYTDASSMQHEVEAHYILLAVPSLALRDVEVEPPFTVSKQKAIREVQYAPSGKIFLQYRRRWWRDPDYKVDGQVVNAPKDGGGGAFTTMGIRQLYFPSDRHSEFAGTDRGVVIVSYTWEQDTLVWGTKNDIVEEAAKQVEKIFPGTGELLETGASVLWENVEWTGGGAFAYFRPGQWTRLYQDVVAPDGMVGDERVLFAGEQCSPIHSWIQGALDSALWACQDLIELDKARTSKT